VTEVVEASELTEVVVAVPKLEKQEGVETGRGNYGRRHYQAGRSQGSCL